MRGSGLRDSYEGATSLFMTVLLNKKYSLPYVLIDALVRYFAELRAGRPCVAGAVAPVSADVCAAL